MVITMSKQPTIRFKGHTRDWTLRKLSTMCGTFEYGLNSSATEYDGRNKYIRITDIDDASREFSTTNLSSPAMCLEGMERYLLTNGDIVFARTGASTGKTYLYKECDGVVYFAGFLIRTKVNKENDPEFIFQNTLTSGYEKYIKITSQRSGQPGVNAQEYGNYELFAPLIEEQIQIGHSHKILDELILWYQHKYDKLLTYKKAMLEKMFPKEGADVPEVRFAGFNGAWKLHKVSDLLVERNEQAPKSKDYPLMAFIAYEGVAPKGDRYDRSSLVNDVENKLYKRTEKGDFIYSSNNLETGSIGLNNYGNASISPVYSIFSATELSDSDFINQRFTQKDFIAEMVKWRQGVIYGQWRIHESDFLKIEVLIPSVEEQTKIGSFLRSLDNLIHDYHSKVTSLKRIKAALLSKMLI